MLSKLVSIMHANIFAASPEVYLAHITDMAEEELLFEASISVCESAALGLKVLVEAFVQCDSMMPQQEVVNCQSNDTLVYSEDLVWRHTWHCF